LWLDGVPRPDHGDGFRQRRCAACGAGWVGHIDDGDDWCPWCEKAGARQIDDERRMLLDPPWRRPSQPEEPRHHADTSRRCDLLADLHKLLA
jgi:uncharacterized Zn finger protein (UPF0148 family)